MQYHYQDLIQLFNKTFSQTHNTRLIKGGDEPIYIPENSECDYNQVIFARGYYASAFHEIAHWCHAGAKRRLLEDYGYWYVPDGRNEQQQAKFEQVEIIPQAIEWAFNVAVEKEFHVSSDNLNGFQADTQGFKNKVFQQVEVFLEQGFPTRANQFIEALAQFYNTELPLTVDRFIKGNEYVESVKREICLN
jgi:elongation factor P hydroxylase